MQNNMQNKKISRRRWKKSELSLLKNMYKNENLTIGQIAKALGRTEFAIRSCLSKYGVYRSEKALTWTPERISKLSGLVQTRKPMAEIAKILGTTVRSVTCAKQQHLPGSPRKPRAKNTKSHKAILKDLKEMKMSTQVRPTTPKAARVEVRSIGSVMNDFMKAAETLSSKGLSVRFVIEPKI